MVFIENVNYSYVLNIALSVLSSMLGVAYGNGVVRRTYTMYKAKAVENIAAMFCGLVAYYNLSEYMGIAVLASFIVSAHVNKIINMLGMKTLMNIFTDKFK